MPLKRVYLSLGSNIGEREENLARALRALERDHIHVVVRSSIYETEPQDVIEQRWFLNQAVECKTRYFPLQLLSVTEHIERELGRERGTGAVRRGPRIIDIDVLLFGNVVMATPQLTIPHPRMLERRFVLQPLLEIAPELRHPRTSEPLSKHLARLQGQKVRRV
ncbi:MAG: 2-amino-4-hydroxy-6-hydroxymethyldihydropteridine diphosphokinase [Bryobacteraceae bacterium]